MLKECDIDILLWDYRPSVKNWKFTDSYGCFWRFYCNCSGVTHFMDTGRRQYTSGPGQAVLIPPLTRFSTQNDGPVCLLYAYFSIPETSVIIPPAIHLVEYRQGLNTACFEFPETPKELKVLYLQQLLTGCLEKLSAEFAGQAEHREAPDDRLTKAVQVLKCHLDQPLSNYAISRKVGISPNTLHRLFLMEYGMTPQQYQRLLRIEEGRRRLRDTEEPIALIAAELGFSDRYHFSKIFKRILMVTPSVFRKNCPR